MAAYILRRLLLVLPTLFGIMLINFTLTQFVPGGPIEQILARMEGGGDAFVGINGADTTEATDLGGGNDTGYEGAQGLPKEFIEELEREFGFDKPPVQRFFLMMWNYLRFDFGDSYFRSESVLALVADKLPVSITLGLWSTLITYLVSIPLGIRKAIRDGSTFDTWTSGLIIVAYAIPGFLFAILLLVLFAGGSFYQIFPLRGLTSDNWDQLSAMGKVLDYLWHIVLPVTAVTISGFATMTLLTKNSFVFRNAMLIVISGFPALFIGVFFGGSLIIETLFSLDGLGRLGFEAAVARDYPVVFGTLFAFSLIGLIVSIITDLTYVFIDPRIDFEARN